MLLVRRDALVLDLCLDVVNRVGRFDLKSDGFAGQRLREDLHSTTEIEDERVSVHPSSSCLPAKMLVRRDALLVPDLRLDAVDRVRRFDLKSDGFVSQRLHE